MLKNIKYYGFTLIQLLIVIATIGILATLAVPSYRSYIIKNNSRAAAQTALKDGQYLQKWFSLCGNYARDSGSSATPQCFLNSSSDSNIAWPILPYLVAPESGTALYKIGFSSGAPSKVSGVIDVNSFRLIATPICGKPQESSGCICIDQDLNIIENTNASCNNASGLCPCTN